MKMRVFNTFYCLLFVLLNEFFMKVNSDSNEGGIIRRFERKVTRTRPLHTVQYIHGRKTDEQNSQSLPLHFTKTFEDRNVNTAKKAYMKLTTVLLAKDSSGTNKKTSVSNQEQWMSTSLSRKMNPVKTETLSKRTVSQGTGQGNQYITAASSPAKVYSWTSVLLKNHNHVTDKVLSESTDTSASNVIEPRPRTSTSIAQNTTLYFTSEQKLSMTKSGQEVNESATQPSVVVPVTERFTIKSSRTRSSLSKITSPDSSSSETSYKIPLTKNPTKAMLNPIQSTPTKKHKQWATTKVAEKNPATTPALSTKSKHHPKSPKYSSTTKEPFKTSYSHPSRSKYSSKSGITQESPTTTSILRSKTSVSMTVPSERRTVHMHTTSTQTGSNSNSFTRSKEHKESNDKTTILINEIAISHNRPDEQFIELKMSSDNTMESYEVVVFSGMGEVLSTSNVQGNTGNHYTIVANEDIHVNIIQELQEKKSIAVAVYHRSESASSEITMQTKGVMDAIVLTAYDGKPSDQLMQHLMNNNVSPFHVSESALQHGGSISRCAENHVRDTQDFVELSKPKATRGFKNAKCPRNSFPLVSHKSLDNIKLTLIVVTTCLALFCVIVLFVVIIMKRKQQQMKVMQASLWEKSDDDEDVVLKMGSVKFEGSPEEIPTFNNEIYLSIKS